MPTRRTPRIAFRNPLLVAKSGGQECGVGSVARTVRGKVDVGDAVLGFLVAEFRSTKKWTLLVL